MSRKSSRQQQAKLPVATVIYYGPDDKTATKAAVTIIKRWGEEPAAMNRWWGMNVARDPNIQKEIADFIREQGARSVVVTDGVFGCPHEEGIDFPVGVDCPFCPFWKGKQ